VAVLSRALRQPQQAAQQLHLAQGLPQPAVGFGGRRQVSN
jgi:hypothetical protein